MFNYKKEILYPLLSASVLIAVVVLSLFYTTYQLNEVAASKDLIDIQRFNIIQLRSAILDAENSQRGYLLTNNVTFLEHYEESKVEVRKSIENLKTHNDAFPTLLPLINNVQQLCADKFDIIEASINVQFNAGSYASHLTLSKDKGKMVMEEIRKHLSDADNLLVDKRKSLETKMQSTLRFTVTAAIALVLTILGILVFSYRRTLKLFKEILSSSTKVDHLNYQATHDSLTNLYNRRGFGDLLERIHENAQLEKRKYAIFYMDLDGFKAVNDQFSHEIGDQLLISVSQIFQNILRENDCLARLGGDEFTLIVRSFRDKDELIMLAERLIHALKEPIKVDNMTIQVGVSIGVAIYRVDGFNTEKLMAAADSAMYKAKKAGKNCMSFFH
jgi:diguanylate cyclase (GGDEF)-like protein